MDTRLEDKIAPNSGDLDGWRSAVRAELHHAFRTEDLIAAIQDLGPGTDKAVLNPLAKEVSDRMMGCLRKLVDKSYPNEGDDIIWETQTKLWTSLLQPNSRDGRGLRKAFYHRVRFRLLDQFRQEQSAKNAAGSGVQPAPPNDELGGDGPDVPDIAADSELAARAVDLVRDEPDSRKRLALHLHLDGVPFKSKRGSSIAGALGVSERTARQWVKEMIETLNHKLGDEL